MNKRALLLSATAFALLSGPAFAATDTCSGDATTTSPPLCDIDTTITTALATSTVQTGGSDILIDATGAINVTTATAPALKIDSDNNVTNEGTISNKNTPNAIGVEMIAGLDSTNTTTIATYNGLVSPSATNVYGIDLSGSGTGKTGFLLAPLTALGTGTIDATTDTLPEDSGVAPGVNIGSMNVVGDGSYGVHLLSGVTLDGNLSIDGPISVKSSTTSAGTSTGVVGVEVDGNIVGDLNIAPTIIGGSVSVIGASANGVLVYGSIDGSIYNGGAIVTAGSSTTPTSTTGNPQGGTAFLVANSVTQGIYNGGPIDGADYATDVANGVSIPSISSYGTGPAFLISSTAGSLAAPLNIGLYVSHDTDGNIVAPVDPGYDFYNRGQIAAQPQNVDNSVIGMEMVGAVGAPVVFQGGTIGTDSTEYAGGILNSGAISAASTTDTNYASGAAATGLLIGNFVTVPRLTNTSEVGPEHGNITASVSGASPGQAIAILINCGNGTTCNPAGGDGYGELDALYNSGSISASATSTDTATSFLTAIAIDDKPGMLTSIHNSGTISATACATSACVDLDNKAGSTRTALNTANNTHDVDFENSGSVLGDVIFGSGRDTLHVFGASSAHAGVSGNINFNGSNGAGSDTLAVDNFAGVTGAVLESNGGYVNTTVALGGTLIVNNTDFAGNSSISNGSFEVGTLDVADGGTLGLTLSQGFNRAAQVDETNPYIVSTSNAGDSGAITLESGSQLNVYFGSFVSTPGGDPAKFVLFDAPSITIGSQDDIKGDIKSSIPFLFTGNVCGYGITGFIDDDASACTDTPGHEQLVVDLQPKSAETLGLSGYAEKIFPYANQALANDNTLGSAIIAAGSGITAGQTDAGDALYQDIYSQFAPDVSGGARAIAVSLTDEATSVLGAHQRELRMYAGKDAAATLWGQEFVQRLDNGTDNPNGFRDSGFGFALGADGGSPSSGRYGAAFTFFSGDILEKIPAQVKTSTEWYMLSGYTDWRGKGLFFDSQVTVGYGSLSGRRSIFVDNQNGQTLFARTATNKRASLLGAAGFSTGAVLNMGTLVIMPQFSMDALTLRENGYRESGGGDGFDLQVDPYYGKSLRGYLGSTFREDLNLGGFYLQPEARVGYRYDFLADAVDIKARFAADPTNAVTAGDPFTLTGPAPAKGSLVLGAGFAATTGSWSLGLNYDFLSGGGLTQQTGTLTLIGRL